MTTWTIDGVSAATPLDGGVNPGLTGMLLGKHAGCLGETCAAALLIGGIYLLIRKVISPWPIWVPWLWSPWPPVRI